MDFAFRRPCPVECEAYSSGVSEKQNNKSFLCDLSACPACPVECLPREMRSLFNWGGAYSSGVAPEDGTGACAVNNVLSKALSGYSVFPP